MAKRKVNSDENPPDTDLNSFIKRLFDEMIEVQGAPLPGAAYRFDIRVNQDGITITPNANGQIQSMEKVPRDPLVDIIEKKEIELHADHERLSVRAGSGKGSYSKLITLPSKVDPATAIATYKNGVLEVSLKRSNTYKSIVKIDVK